MFRHILYHFRHLLWNCSNITIRDSDMRHWKAGVKQLRNATKAMRKLSKRPFFFSFFFHARQWECIRYDASKRHTRIYPQLLALNKNTKCIHQYSHIFCLLWQLFNSYSSLCKWADSLPLPIVVKWYGPLNINDWEWLIDPPTRRPPQTDRNSDRHMHLSRSFLTFLSVALALSVRLTHSLANPLSHTVIHIKTC